MDQIQSHLCTQKEFMEKNEQLIKSLYYKIQWLQQKNQIIAPDNIDIIESLNLKIKQLETIIAEKDNLLKWKENDSRVNW
jgi:hypothetical protein